ncbi:putative outer membrane protein PmpA, partial [Frankliniella fusca]
DIKEFIARTVITTDLIHRSSKLREILNYCCALPILPKEQLQNGLKCLLSRAAIFNGFVKYCLESLFRHLEMQWLNDPVKGTNFVVCDDMIRSNFNSEDLKFTTNRALRNFNGDFYFIPRYVQSCVNKSHRAIDNIMAVNQANYTSGPRALIEDPQIEQLTMSLRRNPSLINVLISQLLAAASEKLSHVNFDSMKLLTSLFSCEPHTSLF